MGDLPAHGPGLWGQRVALCLPLGGLLGKGSGQELQQDRGRADPWFVDRTALPQRDPGN